MLSILFFVSFLVIFFFSNPLTDHCLSPASSIQHRESSILSSLYAPMLYALCSMLIGNQLSDTYLLEKSVHNAYE